MSEFPEGAETPPHLSRRELLVLVGANAALAGVAGCSRGSPELIVPYVRQPPEVTPGVPSHYATTMMLGGYGTGLVVASHEGRPIKAEGNALHPASLGALGTFEQASVLSLYDPARARELTREGLPSTWRTFLGEIGAPPPPGKRIHVLLEPTSSPHVGPLVERLRRKGTVVHYDAPLSRATAYAGAELAFGKILEARWDFARADVVLALDVDFLAVAGTPAVWPRSWAERRRMSGSGDAMSRLYVVEPRLTTTGMSADERLRVQAREVRGVAASVLAALAVMGGAKVPGELRRAAATRPVGPHDAWARAVAHDLYAHAGASLVLAGDGQPPEVHALAHAANDLLGNAGRTVDYAAPPVIEAGQVSHGLEALVRSIDAGDVAALVIVGGNPAYTAAADQEIGRRIAAVPATAYVGVHDNETARLCRWFVPEAHFLEAWSDARAFDGTASVAQPLMRPLSEGKTVGQVLAGLDGATGATSRELVEAHWKSVAKGDSQASWEQALVRGVVDATREPAVATTVAWSAVAHELATPAPARAALEIVFFADAKVHDGRFGESAWLQELGDPVTKLAWDNAALVSPSTAARLGLANEDVVAIEVRGRSVRAPVLVLPAMADDVVALALGYGRSIPDRVSSGVGANAYSVRDSRAPWFDDASLHKTGESWPLALTQEHWSMEGRPIVLSRTLDDYRADPAFAAPHNETRRSLYGIVPDAPHQWGMTIDLNACTGCSACVVACMAENNIPVVGKGGVRLSREMQWLRIDRYLSSDTSGPAALVQPMLCQHCEKAPCEYVCPVNATVHSHDGLNEMVYNRCVGTRFCSNNCPYKVRRFNFFNYTASRPEALSLAMNPDVTVRARGVMEKCTYCVQRIRRAEIPARREERPIRDLEIQTACQQTCPTGAIVFGDIADPATRVSAERRNERLYAVLDELGTIPRTRYLARITNPNAEIPRS
ncbi:MAG TPA: 4Fe-4S dicluster domain-containing protein [Polyangiaceae bacterium]|jgi:Fe-S-cluster-containing dehydrogenase component|nr:4Fe-4S dicluster domain-containing protein [Polyangiaceae bacterium]